MNDDLSFIPEEHRIAFQERLDARPTNAAGEPLCACGSLLGSCYSHFDCAKCNRERRRKGAEDARKKVTHENVVAAVQSCLETVPAWTWARFGDPLFKQRAPHARLHGAAAKWVPAHGSLILLGPTGCGKSTTACAIVNRLSELAVEDAKEGSRGVWRSVQFKWTTGPELASARRKHPLGEGEAPLVEAACEWPLLVLDEIGFEGMLDTTFTEVVDARYRTALPTILTTGLTAAAFAARYGDASWRRLAQRGAVIECWGAGG